jgi:hypothetical protein
VHSVLLLTEFRHSFSVGYVSLLVTLAITDLLIEAGLAGFHDPDMAIDVPTFQLTRSQLQTTTQLSESGNEVTNAYPYI